MKAFSQALADGDPLIFDGAMGSLLSARGGEMGGARNNLDHGTLVQQIHQEYLEAGSNCLTTNTFTLNGIYAEKHQYGDCSDAVKAACELALAAGEGRAYLWGDLGPAGEMLQPLGSGKPAQFHEAYCRQVELMAAYPITGLLIETIFDLKEALIILAACRDAAPQLPVITSLTYATAAKGGRTIMGDAAKQIAAQLAAAGSYGIGANCGDLSPLEYASILGELTAPGLPVLVQPNAGKPMLQGTEVVYPLGPAEFAAQMLHCQKAGARLFGGCCGTTPAHIQALAQALAARPA